MLYLIFYLLMVTIVFFAVVGLCIFSFYSLVANIMGAPYVPTKQKEIDFILDYIKLKKGQNVIELGSGDGRFIRSVVKKYDVNGLGVDIQPWLLFYARMRARMEHLTRAVFVNQNLFKTDLSSADVLFLFLMPNTLKKLVPKFEKETKKSTLFISHGFVIEGWEKYLFDKIPHTPFPTYFYRRK